MYGNFFALACLVPLLSVTTTVCVATVTAQNIHQYVAQGDDISVLQFLNNHGNIETIDPQGNTLLHIAVRDCSNSKMTKFLIERGADVNATNNSGQTPLEFALKDGESEDVVDILLNNGADMDLLDNSGHSIYENAEYERKANAEILKRYRKNHEIQDNTSPRTNDNDNEKLEKLVQNGNTTALELRLQQKWNVNSRDNSGSTLLHLAVQKKDVNMVRLLLQYGANVNATNGRGETPLHIAVNSGSNTMAKILLDYGADYNLNNNSGRSAYICATANQTKDPDMFNILDSAEKNPQQPNPVTGQRNISHGYQMRTQKQNPWQNNSQIKFQQPEYQRNQQIYRTRQPQRSFQRYSQQNAMNGNFQNNRYQGNNYYNGNIPYQGNGYYNGNIPQNMTPQQLEKMQKRQAVGNIANAFISMFTN